MREKSKESVVSPSFQTVGLFVLSLKDKREGPVNRPKGAAVPPTMIHTVWGSLLSPVSVITTTD